MNESEILSKALSRITELENKVEILCFSFDRILRKNDERKLANDVLNGKLPLLFAKIIDIICKDNLTTFESVINERNELKNQTSRHFIHYVLQKYFNEYTSYSERLKLRLSLASIGYITNRDHASVCHSIKKIKDFCDTDLKYKEKFESIVSKCEIEIIKESNKVMFSSET